ncbi:hypothetical protein BKA82DRAFT_4112897 [Pisolithus tinctorius]|nr:hypothetical protein BKA82DRAFT_4112897 [Pisolithus tinctorius]
MAPQQNHQDVLMSDQRRLSEQLQLLYHFGYSDIDMRYQDVDHLSDRHRQKWYGTKSTIRILDTIAVALTTGRPRDVFAAAFDTHGGVTLVLAKNDSPTAEDDRAVRDLFGWITAPETTGAYDVLPFLFTRCGANIAKRIAKMDDAVRGFSHGIEEVLRNYTPEPSVDKEFPLSTDYLDLQYRGQQVPFEQIMRDLLGGIMDRVGDFTLQNISATPDLYPRYITLVFVAFVLKRSRLLRSLRESTSPMDRNRKLQAERLKRRIAKVCQYYDGIAELVDLTRRHFPQGIAHRWVDPICDTGETAVDLEEDYLVAIERALGGVSPSTDTLTTLHGKFPNMGGTWGASRSITTRLHAEIHILLHLSKSFGILDRSQQQPIGCSKRSCLCCTLWIWAYNNKYRTKWLTSGSHGKPYSSWALPGCSYAHACVADGRSEVDIAVMRGVRERLIQTIFQLFPNQRRLSDEYWSSGSEPRQSDGEVEMWRELRESQTFAAIREIIFRKIT